MVEPAEPRSPKYVAKIPVAVWAFLPNEVVRGQGHRLAGQRLSDLVNDVLTPTLRGPRLRFVSLTQVTIQPVAGGDATEMPYLALNKAQTLFLGELGTGAEPGGLARQPGNLMAVRLTLSQGHQMQGLLYRPDGKRISDVLNDDREFLPLIEAVVRWPAGVARRFPFLLANKAHLSRVDEAPAP